MLVVAGAGYATSPMVKDTLPDIRLLYVLPGDTPDQDDWELDTDSFDLDDFIIDSDTAPGDITWTPTIDTGNSEFRDVGGVPLAVASGYTLPTVNGDNTVDIWGFDYTGTVALSWSADDGVNTPATADQMIHFSSFRIRTPRVVLDNRVGGFPKTQVPFTWVIVGNAMTSPLSLVNPGNMDLFVSGGGGLSGSPIVSGGLQPDYDTIVKYLDGTDANVASTLSISVDTNGFFSIIPVLDSDGLPVQDRPVLVSFVASLPDGTSDWDGVTIFLAPPMTPEGSPKPTVEAFSSFEDFATGATVPNVAGGYTHGWASVAAKTTGDHQIVDTGYPSPTVLGWPGAVSGNNVLQLTLGPSAGQQVRIISDAITPIEPGATYGLSLNVATDSTNRNQTPRVFLRARGLPAGDNTSGLKVGKSGMPSVNEGWMQLFTTYTAPEIESICPTADGSGTVNLHYQGAMVFLQFASFPNATEDVNMWVDNVHFYKLSDGPAASMDEEGMADADLAVGRSAMEMSMMANATAVPTPVMGDFEGASLAATGWDFTEDVLGDTHSQSVVQQQPKAAKIDAGSSLVLGEYSLDGTHNHTNFATATNSFRIQLNGASGREATPADYGIRYALRGIYDDGAVPDPAVYTARCYLQSDASVLADGPIATFGMTNVGPGQFDTLATTVLQSGGIPFGVNNIDNSSVWRRVAITATFVNTTEDPLQPLAVYFQAVARVRDNNGTWQVRAPLATYANDPILGTAAGYDTLAEMPAANGDANLYFDDVSIESVNPKFEYYDADVLFDPF
jgi:hypothetical protein